MSIITDKEQLVDNVVLLESVEKTDAEREAFLASREIDLRKGSNYLSL